MSSTPRIVVRFDVWYDPSMAQRLAREPDIELRTCARQGADEAAWGALAQAHAYQIPAAKDELPAQWFASRALLARCPKLMSVSASGAGYDTVDVAACTEMGLPLLFTPGVNHTTVAEHTFLLLLALEKHLLFHCDSTRAGGWKRKTGHEILGKRIGIVGLGRIGREVAIRARAFGMQVTGYDLYWDDAFAAEHTIERAATIDDVFAASDILSLHTNLTDETRDLVRAETIDRMKPGVIILNCARGEIVNTADMATALQSGRVAGYGTDVLDAEPPPADHPLLGLPNCIVTPHVGSRTSESVERQAVAAVTNLMHAMRGEKPLAQVNPEVPVTKHV